MGPLHTYSATITWTGAGEAGTASYTSYSRNHEVALPGKPVLLGTSDPAFRGDPDRYTPEELLVVALSQCHMLWFLHLASSAGITVTSYVDQAGGTMRIESQGAGQFTDVALRPRIGLGSPTTRSGEPVTDELVAQVHDRAHQHCFISRSVNFPVRIDPVPLEIDTSTERAG